MVTNFAAIGLLVSIASVGERPVDQQPFRTPLRALGAGLAAVALGIAGVWVTGQAVNADELMVRPQLSLQADGGRRYQYNPRVLDAARTLPRGVIHDRRGIPLAADAAAVGRAEADLKRLGVSVREACAKPEERCYPLGGRAFHLVGDATTRLNWAASNSSYAERDAEDALRGYDDRATTVRTGTGDGPVLALRRDYRDLVPLVRHRWEPEHPSVRALRERARDVQLTIDARLQSQLASLLARRITSSGAKKGAIVVVDAESGELLASVSYPWPSSNVREADEEDALLDRARYGLYPPGSTFKLVTAAAALGLDPGLHDLRLTCTRLTDGRVGAHLPGWNRPIRDDVLDRQPHGSLAMREGLVHSCNAYFAQLAVRLGNDPIARAASAAGLVYPSGSEARERENLPYAGYGQGDVLATPLRMARVVAAIATDGQIREPSIVRVGTASEAKPWITERAARVLAEDMRAVVTSGTGRLLAGHQVRIAGKTGTAEVDDAPSHAWFVGFAPHGAATRRIAFAVLIEHAGYGGQSAATVAGDAVAAAASLGLVR
jgi:peptidoglycan glycosyltransferase